MCASRIPTKQENDLGSCTLERIARMGDILRILTKEIAVSKSAQAAFGAKIVEARDVKRGLEEHRNMLEGEIEQAQTASCAGDPEAQFKIKFISGLNSANTEKLGVAVKAIKEAEADFEGSELKVKLQELELSAITEEWNNLKSGGRPAGLHPWPMFYPVTSEEEVQVAILAITLCSLCRHGFPDRDILVAGCMHIYHPWCAYSVFGKGSRCVARNCTTAIHPSWYQSFGWGMPSDELQEEAAKLDTDVVILQYMHEREESLNQGRPVQEKKDKQPAQETESNEKHPGLEKSKTAKHPTQEKCNTEKQRASGMSFFFSFFFMSWGGVFSACFVSSVSLVHWVVKSVHNVCMVL